MEKTNLSNLQRIVKAKGEKPKLNTYHIQLKAGTKSILAPNSFYASQLEQTIKKMED